MRGGDEFRGWGVDRYLYTRMVDALHENTYAVIAMGGTKKKPKPPEPTYRPKDKPTITTKAPDPKNPFFQRLQAAKRARNKTNDTRST